MLQSSQFHNRAFWCADGRGEIITQGLVKRAIVEFGALMRQIGVAIHIDMLAQSAPQSAKTVVFGQVATGFRVNHHIEKAVV